MIPLVLNEAIDHETIQYLNTYNILTLVPNALFKSHFSYCQFYLFNTCNDGTKRQDNKI